MSQPKPPSPADDLPFKDVPIQREPDWRPRARFLGREDVQDLPIPTFVTFATFADACDKPKWPKSKS